MTVLKSVLPIWIAAFAPLYTLMMLLGFDWTGRILWIASISLGMYFSARNVFKHHSLKFGGTVSDKVRLEAQDYVFGIFLKKGVNR